MAVIWLCLSNGDGSVKKKASNRDKPQPSAGPTKSLVINPHSTSMSSSQLKRAMMALFDLDDKSWGARLRNAKHHLIPINLSIAENKKEHPYFLEPFSASATRNRASITNSLSSDSVSNVGHIKMPMYREATAIATKAVIDYYVQRVSALENMLNKQKQQQQGTLNFDNSLAKKIEDIDKQVSFIEKRMAEVKKEQWNGGFTKALLW